MNIKKRKKLGTLLMFIMVLPSIVLCILGLVINHTMATESLDGIHQFFIIYFVFQLVVLVVCFAIGYYYEAIYTPMQEQNAILEEMSKEKKSNNE